MDAYVYRAALARARRRADHRAPLPAVTV